MRLDDIVFGAGTNDSTKVSFKYDENNRLAGLDIQDMKTPKKVLIKDELERIAYITEQTTVDDAVAEAIQEMLDGGGRYGEDFDLEVKDGKLKLVPKVINETDGEIPELAGDAFNRYKELIGKGVHAGEDFDVIYQEDGTFRFDLKNNQATDFGASYKNEIYDSNGNFLSSLTVVGDKVIKETALNGERNTVEMPFEEAFMQLLIEGNFSIAGEILGKNDLLSGGYNIYKSADQYKQIFGRELIADVCDKKEVSKNSREQKAYKNLLNKLLPHSMYYGQSKEYAIQDYIDGYNEIKFVLDFNPYDSKMAGILPNNERIMNGEKSFTERCNNDKFEVEYDDKTIKISKNGKGVKEVDVSNLPPSYVQENLVKIPASVLYDMAICDIKLKVDDTVCERAAGYYKPTENSISLDPNVTSSNRLLQVIVHESGHMCDFINDVENAKRAVKELMKDPMMHIGRDKPLTLSEAVENLGTNQSVAIQDEKLSEIYKKEYENFIKNCPKINNSFTYALTDMVEFFAESYTLLNMGADKSEYVLINYFPQSLQRAKEIMEANREFYEKN
jgi:hypothetical protein